MKILVACGAFPPAYLSGGPIRSITAMLDDFDPRHEVMVITNNYDKGSSTPLVAHNQEWKSYGRARVLYVDPGWSALLAAVRRSIRERPDVVYVNSLFSIRLSVVFQVLGRLGTFPHLAIAPRGELDPGALGLKSGKKRLFLKIANVAVLYRKALWHASSAMEADNIRRSITGAERIVVRENDTLLPQRAERPDGLTFNPDTRPLNAVFFSRLSPKKGLHIVLEALADVTTAVRLDVVGPPEDTDYVASCRKLVQRLPANVRVDFKGPVHSDESRTVLSKCDVLVFPTAGENFGHVIAESLSVSCPVLCADTTPWSVRLRDGGGQVVPSRESTEWAEAIESYAQAGPSEWHQRRLDAAEAYDRWRSESLQPHFFDMLETASKIDIRQA